MHRPSLYTVCGDDTLQLHLRASFNASNVSDIKTYEAMEINCSACASSQRKFDKPPTAGTADALTEEILYYTHTHPSIHICSFFLSPHFLFDRNTSNIRLLYNNHIIFILFL